MSIDVLYLGIYNSLSVCRNKIIENRAMIHLCPFSPTAKNPLFFFLLFLLNLLNLFSYFLIFLVFPTPCPFSFFPFPFLSGLSSFDLPLHFPFILPFYHLTTPPDAFSSFSSLPSFFSLPSSPHIPTPTNTSSSIL